MALAFMAAKRFDPKCPCAGSCCTVPNWLTSSYTINCNGHLIIFFFCYFNFLQIIAPLTAQSCPVISWSSTLLFHDKRHQTTSLMSAKSPTFKLQVGYSFYESNRNVSPVMPNHFVKCLKQLQNYNRKLFLCLPQNSTKTQPRF